MMFLCRKYLLYFTEVLLDKQWRAISLSRFHDEVFTLHIVERKPLIFK